MKAVFDTRPETKYDDEIVSHYHFPRRYLAAVSQCVGDWIIYREGQRGHGRRGYVAVARVEGIESDPSDSGRYYARVSGFLPFNDVVPLRRRDNGYHETELNDFAPDRVGVALRGRSVRILSEAEFAAIVWTGLRKAFGPDNVDLLNQATESDAYVFLTASDEEKRRRIARMLVSKPIRDASFRKSVLEAYDSTCAASGLRVFDGAGRAEAQAAHVWAVKDGGPDIVSNGIALSATCHWLFDRYLISLDEQLGLLVSDGVPRGLTSLLHAQEQRILLPGEEGLWPRLDFVRRHRERYWAQQRASSHSGAELTRAEDTTRLREE